MSKRFTKCDTVIRDNGEEMSQAEVRDMLNNQHERIEYLTKMNTFIMDKFAELVTYMSELGFDVELEDKDGNIFSLTDDVRLW